MQRETVAQRRPARRPSLSPRPRSRCLPQARILALQRTAGNRAATQMIARAEKTKPWLGEPPALPASDWYAEDRAANTGTWHTANEYNLRNGKNTEYPNPGLRSAFYRWFYSTMNPDEQVQLVNRLKLLTFFEQARFLSSYADRVARAGIFPYRLLEGMSSWSHDLAGQLTFVDDVLQKKGYSWVDISYEWVKPMIKSASSAQRKKISGERWAKIFIDICDDDDIDAAVADLELGEQERKEWVAEEKSFF